VKIESIAIGDEILSGTTVDTNLSVLAQALEGCGLVISSHTVVGDSKENIALALIRAVKRSKIVIVSGGLGPTSDDITREAASRAFKRRLRINAQALKHIQERFHLLRREMAPTNIKQAMFPDGSEPLRNEKGTAWGFRLRHGRSTVFFLPGVPGEFHWMLDAHIVPFLGRGEPIAVKWLKVFGLPESRIDYLLKDTDLPGIKMGFYPHFPEVHVKLIARGKNGPQHLRRAEKTVRKLLYPHVFGIDKDSMEGVVGRLLLKKRATIAVAESCTGGYIFHRLTRIPGSSRYMERGFVCYSDRSKVDLLGVKKTTLKKYGAVSEKAALEMARGARRRAGTTYGLSITGIAGPTGGTRKKPVGTVYIALSGPDGDEAVNLVFPGTREQVTLIASEAALDLARRRLMSG